MLISMSLDLEGANRLCVTNTILILGHHTAIRAMPKNSSQCYLHHHMQLRTSWSPKRTPVFVLESRRETV